MRPGSTAWTRASASTTTASSRWRSTAAVQGTWAELVALGPTLIDNAPLDAQAEACCRVVVTRLADALERPREAFLSEDYAVFAVTPAGRRRRASGCSPNTGRHRPAAARRSRTAQRAGDRGGPAPPHLVPDRRPRRADLERGVRLRRRGGAPRRRSRSWSSATRSCCSTATTISCSMPSWRASTTSCRRTGSRTCSAPGDTRARRDRCTRCRSTCASCSTAPRTR